MIRCPDCFAPLLNVVELKLETPRIADYVHVAGGKSVRVNIVSELMGECLKHGYVRTVRKQQQ